MLLVKNSTVIIHRREGSVFKKPSRHVKDRTANDITTLVNILYYIYELNGRFIKHILRNTLA